MKKFTRSLAIVLALAASSAIVLHAGHLDSEHTSTASSSHCGICQTTTNTAASVPVFEAPSFLITESLTGFCYIAESSSTLSLENPRGPPAPLLVD